MNSFYLILMGGSGVYLLAQLVAYVFFGRVFFRDTGVLFESSKNRFQWQAVFPKNLLLLIIFVFFTSFFGYIMDLLGVIGWLSLPLGAIGGLAVNFAINIAILPALLKTQHSGAPTDEQLDNADAVAQEEILPDSYGRICVKSGRKSYYFDALTANGNPIRKGEKVVVIHAQEGLCFVESAARLYDILFEEQDGSAEEINEEG